MKKQALSLTASPTFKHLVLIPVPGADAAPVEFTFKHKTGDALKEFVKSLEGREDADIILDVASGWSLDDAFEEENITRLCQNYIGSARAIMDTYLSALTGAKAKN